MGIKTCERQRGKEGQKGTKEVQGDRPAGTAGKGIDQGDEMAEKTRKQAG